MSSIINADQETTITLSLSFSQSLTIFYKEIFSASNFLETKYNLSFKTLKHKTFISQMPISKYFVLPWYRSPGSPKLGWTYWNSGLHLEIYFSFNNFLKDLLVFSAARTLDRGEFIRPSLGLNNSLFFLIYQINMGRNIESCSRSNKWMFVSISRFLCIHIFVPVQSILFLENLLFEILVFETIWSKNEYFTTK